ncbi:hypothetical protein RUM43_013197 [Polyplax serrata]|uniref:ABC transporter domain-containing protein n=1 Tax=Polyplax serrata TaxID=468196 RepID=A0AAN8P323_POLSC
MVGSLEDLVVSVFDHWVYPKEMEPSCVLGEFHPEKTETAVSVRNAFKQYGIKQYRNVVLNGLNMTVRQGTIYGLLGASGCGKTTLLTCIIGRRRLNSGDLWVLGGKPGEEGSGIPGPRVGYMPQEIALVKEFTIAETLRYFGWIYGLKLKYIKQRTKELVNFLDLPSSSSYVRNLSGGQQRRVSFAAALLHDPELLILDEPTVGVDPVLRQNIWDYLIDITSRSHKTVIITTHYIEEARQAQAIGLMREGVLLAEESPKQLLQRFQCSSLEEVFLNLSVRQQNLCQKTEGEANLENRQLRETPENSSNFPSGDLKADTESNYDYNKENYEEYNTKPSFKNHMKALVWKNILWIERNIPIMLFIFVLPMIQMCLFCTTIGRDPKGLHLAVVNHELNEYQSCDDVSYTNECNFTMLSCQYLRFLKNSTSIVQDNFDSLSQAREAVEKGQAWGVIHFNENYSQALFDRIDLGSEAPEETVTSADILVNLDMSNQAIGFLLSRDLAYVFLEFIRSIIGSCNWNPKVVEVPIRFNTPAYGEENPRFLDFTSPGSLLAMIFILAVALTGGSILTEKSEGTIERCLVAGVNMHEILLSHIITEFVIVAGQILIVLGFAFVIFDLQNIGSWSLVILLSTLQGINGMSLGFLLSSLFDSQVMATLLGVGYFLAILFLSGILWPVEGMHWILQYFVWWSPLTYATEAMRSIMLRGWGITEPVVYIGIISTVIWIKIYLSLTLISLKLKKAVH